MDVNADYDENLRAAITAAIDAGDESIGAISFRLGDVDPFEIVRIVADLDRVVSLKSTVAGGEVGTDETIRSRLPIPHPLDYDWRLTRASARSMSELLTRNGPPIRIMLVGVPTVFAELIDGGDPGIEACLYDQSNATVRTFSDILPVGWEAVSVDARVGIPLFKNCSVAFLDPPWYPDDATGFLQFASAGCNVGSSIYMSIPGIRTRPNISRERTALYAAASSCGLAVGEVLEGELTYESPPFEQRTFRRAGLDIPINWRRGTLQRFVKQSDQRARRAPVAFEDWKEETYKGVRFRVRTAAGSEDGDPLLYPAVEGGVLNTISRRDPRRGTVTVWTSGNGVYLTSGPAKLLCILRALARGESATEYVAQYVGRRLSATEIDQVDAVEAQIEGIATCESGLSR